ncbi:HEPN domain-containing protein [Acutalibacter sp. 1XD8-36]|uniref:HEPN domain-containing protein n=1 Tax=Acutalibacter sp. 1XD8-36 TaxID=2320852 RepID=UPI00260178E0|nr:HEPN domain-containing protein [Acutalibacter sp. 1XD8-36]
MCEDYVINEFAKAAYWLDCADYDLQMAKAMLETKRFLYVGFMCHQTIEKGLKAVFFLRLLLRHHCRKSLLHKEAQHD